MQKHAKSWHAGIVRLFICQIASGIFVSALLLLWQDFIIAVACLYGVLLTVANGAWLASEVKIATAMAADEMDGGEQVLYRSAAQRFVVMLLAFVLAWWVGLHLLAVAFGLLVAHLATFGYSMYVAYTED
ncbi:MAG: hypothetical protein R8L53_08130 [Mariprofundales bacterium]